LSFDNFALGQLIASILKSYNFISKQQNFVDIFDCDTVISQKNNKSIYLTIIENIILGNQYGIFSWNSPNNTIENNTFRDNMGDIKNNLAKGSLIDVVALIRIAGIFSVVTLIPIIMVKIVKRSAEKK